MIIMNELLTNADKKNGGERYWLRNLHIIGKLRPFAGDYLNS